MARTMLGRLTFTHLMLAVATALGVACIGSYLFTVHYTRERVAELVAASEALAELAAPRLLAGERAELALLVRTASATLPGRVCVFDADDAALLAASEQGQPSVERELATEFAGRLDASPRVEKVMVECQGGLTYTITAPVRRPPEPRVLGLVVVRCPLAVTRRMVVAQWLSGALGALGSALLAVALALGLGRLLARPIEDVSHAAAALAEGDFAVRVEPRGPLELARLGAALNRCAQQLAELFAALSSERGRLADVLSSMSEGVLALDADGHVALLNEPARRLLGLPEGDLGGAPVASLIEDPVVLAAISRGTGEEPVRVGHRFLRIARAPLSSSTGTVAVIVDVTDAARVERMRRDFLANASHQLRTPLTSIRGYLEALADGTADNPDERDRCLRIALDQVALLQRLVGQLLELSRLQAQPISPAREPLELAALLERACEHLGPMAAERGVRLTMLADARGALSGDADLLLQAIHNLLDNAVQHSPPSSQVRAEIREMPTTVELAVHDAGPGFAEDEAEILWERFHRGDNAGSTGLGLAIAKEIIEAHDGRVFARTGPAGAVFGFRLPRTG